MDKIAILIFSTLVFLFTTDANSSYLTVTGCTNCTPVQLERIQQATKKTNQVINDQCFKDFMIQRKLIQTNEKSNADVVSYLQSSEIKVDTEMYWTIRRVLGYTLPSKNRVWLNRRYMMSWNVCDLASLLAHEASHKAGFDHDFKATSRRPYSVPYSINAGFDACCKKEN